jgi:hypothetical protein
VPRGPWPRPSVPRGGVGRKAEEAGERKKTTKGATTPDGKRRGFRADDVVLHPHAYRSDRLRCCLPLTWACGDVGPHGEKMGLGRKEERHARACGREVGRGKKCSG